MVFPVAKASMMSLSRFGCAPKSWSRVLACASVLAFSALAAGCSSSKQAKFDYPGDPQWNQSPVAEARARKPVVEDDGIEAQAEPPRRQMVEPDDPTEPFSPNYGIRPGDPVRRPADPPRRSPPVNGEGRVRAADASQLPADLPPYFKQRLVQADVE